MYPENFSIIEDFSGQNASKHFDPQAYKPSMFKKPINFKPDEKRKEDKK